MKFSVPCHYFSNFCSFLSMGMQLSTIGVIDVQAAMVIIIYIIKIKWFRFLFLYYFLGKDLKIASSKRLGCQPQKMNAGNTWNPVSSTSFPQLYFVNLIYLHTVENTVYEKNLSVKFSAVQHQKCILINYYRFEYRSVWLCVTMKNVLKLMQKTNITGLD